jgi:hypothetical protein
VVLLALLLGLVPAGAARAAAPMAAGTADAVDGNAECSDTPTHFRIARVRYDSEGGYGEAYYEFEGRVWERWETDFPQGDRNFNVRLRELTALSTLGEVCSRRLTDADLGDFPFLYLSDVGYMVLSDAEAAGLRRYLANGGFVWVDDFWGEAEWLAFEHAMRQVLPDATWQALPAGHPLLHTAFDLDAAPQIPARSFARPDGGTAESPRAHRFPAGSLETINLRAWLDANGRAMVVATHNSDVFDGFEREAYGRWYFERFSTRAYAFGVNIVLYALTH